MEYKKKYLKYKAKYLYFKKQIGGEREVKIYDKDNFKNFLFKTQLDDDDDIEVLKNKLIDLEKEKETDFDDIEIYEKKGFCGRRLYAIDEKMSEFCMLVKRKQEIPKMKLTTGFSLVDTPIRNTTSDDDYRSNSIYPGIVGVFRGKVNKGNQIKGTPLINLEDGEGEYNGYYGSTYIKLVGHFINNKLNGEGNKKISFDNVDNKRHEYEYTGFFENNELIRGKINYKISDSDSNTIEFSKEGTFDFIDRREIIKEGTIKRSDGTILQGTFDFKDGFEIIKEGTIRRSDGTILKGTFDFKDRFEIIKEGTMTRPNGTILQGTFDFKDRFEIIKKGTIRRPDGTILDGTFDFKDGLEIIKEGTMTRPDGIFLKGTFINNTLNGNGEKILFYKDNPYQYIYKGLFKDNSLINGVLTNNFSSDIYEGTFEFIKGRDVLKEGKLIRSGKIYEGTFDYKLSDTKITTKDGKIYLIRNSNGEIYRLTSLANLQSRI